MEVIEYREAPPGSKYIGEMDVYHNRTFYRRVRIMLSQKGNYFVNIPSYGMDDGQGGKKWIPYWEFSKEDDISFKKQCLDAARPHLRNEALATSTGGYVPAAQAAYQPDLTGCPF
jgi:hypothetical protein